MASNNTGQQEKSKKILEVTTFYAPVVGGVETQVEDLSKRLIEKEYEVEVLTTTATRDADQLLNESDVYQGIPVTRTKVSFSISQFHKFAPGFFKLFREKDFDYIHVHGIRKIEGYMALYWAKKKGKKVVASTHNPFTTVERSGLMKFLITLHDLTFGKFFMKKFDHYFLLSETEIPILERFGISKKKMTVVGNAVDDSFFDEVEIDRQAFLEKIGKTEKQWKSIVLGVGRLNYMKGFQNLKMAVENNPDVLFVIVGGDGGYGHTLKDMYERYENLYLTETFYPREQLLEFYAHADIFVLPSLHEPFGIVILEAMAQRCAIIASSNGGPAGILSGEANTVSTDLLKGQKYGVLLNPLNQEEWDAAIKKLSTDKDELKKYQDKAYKRVKDYTWKSILPKYLSVFK